MAGKITAGELSQTSALHHGGRRRGRVLGEVWGDLLRASGAPSD